jgi:hypothetical protein
VKKVIKNVKLGQTASSCSTLPTWMRIYPKSKSIFCG